MPALQGCQDQTCKHLWEHLALCRDTVGGNSMPSAFPWGHCYPWGQWMSETGALESLLSHMCGNLGAASWKSFLPLLIPRPLSCHSLDSLLPLCLPLNCEFIIEIYWCCMRGKWPSPGPPPAAAVETQHCSVSHGVWPLALPRLQALTASHLRPFPLG